MGEGAEIGYRHDGAAPASSIWRKGPRREAGTRYYAGRALRGCGRFRHQWGTGAITNACGRLLSAEVQDSGERPGREAGVRYSARRAPRGRGRCPPLLFSARRWPWEASPQKRTSALSPLGDWARGNPKDRSRIASIRSIELIPPAGGNGLLIPTTPSSNPQLSHPQNNTKNSNRTISSRGRKRRARAKNSSLFQLDRLRR